VKLSKEQPSPPSLTGTSVPVPSGHSWVTDGQGFQWTKWRIGVAVFIVAAIVIALFVAFSHPSSKIHHTDMAGFSQGEIASISCSPLFHGSSCFLHSKDLQAVDSMSTTGDQGGSVDAGNVTMAEPLVSGSPVGSDLGEHQKTKSMQHPIVEEHAQAAVEHSLLRSPEPGAGGAFVWRGLWFIFLVVVVHMLCTAAWLAANRENTDCCACAFQCKYGLNA
jgi:hypothetical protein